MSGRIENLEYGASREVKHRTTLAKHFNAPGLVKIAGKYSRFDFIDEEARIVIELKSTGRHLFSSFTRQLVGLQKINAGVGYVNQGYRAYIVFCYRDDALYSFEITEEACGKFCSVEEDFGYYAQDDGSRATCTACFIKKEALELIKHGSTYKPIDAFAWGFI